MNEVLLRKKLSIIYDLLYETADAVIKRFNPCEVKVIDGEPTCKRGREYTLKTDNFCCGGCKWLGAKGCTVRALSCKLWLCERLIGAPETLECCIYLDMIKWIAWRLNLNANIRYSKEQTIDNCIENYRYYYRDSPKKCTEVYNKRIEAATKACKKFIPIIIKAIEES